jgi:ketosteroid isomerase-like protein
MYHRIVKHKVRNSYRALSRGEHEVVVRQLDPGVRYTFVGDHALGGTRSTADAVGRWFERVFRLFPGLRFLPRDVLVAGWPWNTTVLTVVDLVGEAGGRPYANRMSQRLALSWGRITSIDTLEDTQLLARTLEGMAAAGIAEAVAEPIVG